MPVSIEELRPHLQAFDFPRLFVEGLGWDHYQSNPLVIEVDGGTYTLRTVAEKAGFAAYVCDPGQDGDIPPYPVQRKLEVRVGRTAFEHVIIFVDAQRTRQIWQWAKREPGKSPKPSRWEVREGQGGDPLLQRLQSVVFTLPDEARGIGISDVTSRVRKAFDVEKVTRRSRYAEVRAKLASGEVTEINDLITLNLDIERFAGDVIAQSEGPELLRAFWHAMRDVSVLDPTCGSGAFLFAALNVLEPLYTGCLEGMRGFLDDLQRSERPHSPNALSDFREVLGQVEKHPSERYFILKSIVLNNLYGVDIMEEAVEICKLRLFLKLVAQLESYDQIEPLPDIDFNVRAGNTLVGFTSLDAVRDAMTVMPNGQHRMLSDEDRRTLGRINEDAEIASAAFNQFRWQQTMLGGEVTSADKQALHDRLHSLADELDRLLAAEYGVDPSKAAAYDVWRDSHQPFHWFVEFYGIMSKGGFDVVIGNPPYVEYNKVKSEYTVKGYKTESCGNLYAYVIPFERNEA